MDRLSRGSDFGIAAVGGGRGACGAADDGSCAIVARHLGAGRHLAGRSGDARNPEGPRGFSHQHCRAAGRNGGDDGRDHILPSAGARLALAVGAVRRESRRAGAGHDAGGRISGGPARHRDRAGDARGDPDHRHPGRACLFRADRDRSIPAEVERGNFLDLGTRHPGRAVDGGSGGDCGRSIFRAG